MIKYPSTEQFRQIIKQVRSAHDYKGQDESGSPIYRHDSPYPKLTFEGTIKLHGTNAAIVFRRNQPTEFQSRERVLTYKKDNAGFYAAMTSKDLSALTPNWDEESVDTIVVYGEWCGGNIQKGVAINGLPKMFVVFSVLIGDEWVIPAKYFSEDITSQSIYSIQQFPTYPILIDFNCPEIAQEEIVKTTLAVEEKCPVAAYFGKEGIGEGLVYSEVHNRGLRFKSKGDKHSVSNVTTIAAVDVEAIASMREFVTLAVTENRLKQGLEYLREQGLPITQRSTGDYIRWVVTDVTKEELDTITKSGFEAKKLNPLISQRAKEFYFNNLEG